MQIIKTAIAFIFILVAPGLCDFMVTGNVSMSGNLEMVNVVPPAAPAAYIVVQSTGRQVNGASTIISSTYSAPTTAGNHLYMGYASGGDSPTSVIDSAGNVWKQYSLFVFGQSVGIWASSSAASATWVKATFSGSDNRAMSLYEISGMTQSTGTTSASATLNASHLTTSTMTLSGLTSVAFCLWESNTAGVSYSAGNGYASPVSLIGSSAFQLYSQIRITSVDTPCDANWTGGAGTTRSAAHVWR